MDKKTLLLGVAAVVIIGGGIYLATGGGQSELPTETPEVPEAAQEEGLKEGTYAVEAGSTVEWEGRKTLIDDYYENGTLGVKEGMVVVAGGTVTGGTFVFDMTSMAVETTAKGPQMNGMLINHLKSADFFDVEAHPTATFTITSTAPFEEGATLIKGDLTIKGITQSLEFPAAVFHEGDALRLQATTNIDRTLYDVRYGSEKFFDDLADNVIADDFMVSFDLVAQKN